MFIFINTSCCFFVVFFLLLCSVKKNQTTITQQLYIILLLSCSICCCYNISYLYTIVGLLNTSNNLLYLLVHICLFFLNKKKTTQCLTFYTTTFLFSFFCLFVTEYQIPYNINLNVNLLNGILLLHPVTLYLTYTTTFVLFIFFYFRFYYFTTKTIISKVEPTIILLLYSIPLFLGSSWAEQELLWGGWWSWDFVELLALITLIYLLFLVHNKTSHSSNVTHTLFLFLFLLTTLSVRFNIINSIHNFIPTETQKQYTLYVIYIILFVCLLLCLQKNLFFKEKTFYSFILCFVFYYVVYISLLLWETLYFTFSKINPNQLFFMFFMFTLCYISTTYNASIGFIFPLVWFFNSWFDFLISSLLLLILLNNFFKRGSLVHTTILYVFIHCTHNIYVFKENCFYIFMNNVYNIKHNNIYNTYTNKYTLNKDVFKNQTYITQNNLNGVDAFDKVFFDIFDKCIVAGKSTVEYHSYDIQQLQQIHGFSIFTHIFVLIVYVTFLHLNVKKMV